MTNPSTHVAMNQLRERLEAGSLLADALDATGEPTAGQVSHAAQVWERLQADNRAALSALPPALAPDSTET